MVIYSIVLAGLELVSDDYFFHLSGMFGSEKDVTTNDLLDNGQAWGRSKVKPRTLVLSGYVRSRDVSKLWELNKVLAPNALKAMVVNGQYAGQVEVTSRGGTDNDDNIVTVQLTMPDPYWYAQTAKSIQLGSTSSTALVLPAVLPWTLGSLTGGAGIITNDGNADTYPVIRVVGTCSNISVTNQTTGENVGVSAALSDNDELVIDCRPATCGIYLNGVADIGLKTSPGWMRCVPGDNQIVFTRNSLQNKKHCTVELNERWI